MPFKQFLGLLIQPQRCGHRHKGAPKWNISDMSLFLTKHKPEKHLPCPLKLHGTSVYYGNA